MTKRNMSSWTKTFWNSVSKTWPNRFAKRIIANPQSVSYEEIKQTEEANATLLQAKISDDADKASIDYILSKLDLM